VVPEDVSSVKQWCKPGYGIKRYIPKHHFGHDGFAEWAVNAVLENPAPLLKFTNEHKAFLEGLTGWEMVN
jgi:hypothetical protein